MASSSGNSNSGSEEDLQILMDQRKRKRMESNRESARRSRMRKQQHLDELSSQLSDLRKENNQILSTINITTQHYMEIEAENSVLRARMLELSHRLDSLNEILSFFSGGHENDGFEEPGFDNFMMNNPLNLGYLNHPIMASPDLFQY